MAPGKRRGLAADQAPSMTAPLQVVGASIPERPDSGPSLRELVELTGEPPGEIIAALWALREHEWKRP